MSLHTKVISTGAYLPQKVIKNEDFVSRSFFNKKGEKMTKPTKEIVKKLEVISEIKERRYASDDIDNSQMAYLASENAIQSAGIDRETIDQIIVAHNFGNVPKGEKHLDTLPNIAARVKQKLNIKSESCVAYDLLFGCPGWLQGVIQAHLYLKAGAAKRILVVGSDILSRLVDENDLDSMLFADGAGATILELQSSEEPTGILAFDTISTCHTDDVDYIYSGKRIDKSIEDESIYFLKMNGRGVYKHGLEKVPAAINACLKKAGVKVEEVSKFLIHQANGKMIKQMVQKVFEANGLDSYPPEVLPLSVSFMGNSSVATIPTLWDLINQGELEGHEINSGDVIVLASVGAGMHANCVIYKA
ncbi:MAG: 3-oxoacyl-ACP synthase III family protein [Saprospiraceae bacterium]